MNHHGGDAFDVNLMKHHAHDKVEKLLLLLMMRRTSYLETKFNRNPPVNS